MAAEQTKIIRVFYCYAPEDVGLLHELERHFGALKRLGHITTWHDGEIQAGEDSGHEIDTHLADADIILLLVSPDFMHSDVCDTQMRQALARHRVGEATVI